MSHLSFNTLEFSNNGIRVAFIMYLNDTGRRLTIYHLHITILRIVKIEFGLKINVFYSKSN